VSFTTPAYLVRPACAMLLVSRTLHAGVPVALETGMINFSNHSSWVLGVSWGELQHDELHDINQIFQDSVVVLLPATHRSEMLRSSCCFFWTAECISPMRSCVSSSLSPAFRLQHKHCLQAQHRGYLTIQPAASVFPAHRLISPSDNQLFHRCYSPPARCTAAQ